MPLSEALAVIGITLLMYVLFLATKDDQAWMAQWLVKYLDGIWAVTHLGTNRV